jgi:hypothetical protein
MSCRISLSDVIPIALNAIAMGMSSLKELCRRYNRFALVVTYVLTTRSWVALEVSAVLNFPED